MKVYCEDSFFLHGIKSIFNEIKSLTHCSGYGYNQMAYLDSLTVYAFPYTNIPQLKNEFIHYSQSGNVVILCSQSGRRVLSNIYKNAIILSSSLTEFELIDEMLNIISTRQYKIDNVILEPRDIFSSFGDVLVIKHLLKGYSIRQTAEKLNLTCKVVSRYKREVMKKIGVNTTVELMTKLFFLNLRG